MKKLVTFAVLFALAFGITAGLTAVNANAIGYGCRIIEGASWCKAQTGPLCTDPMYPYYRYWCDGVFVPGGGYCNCHFVGCCEFPDWP